MIFILYTSFKDILFATWWWFFSGSKHEPVLK